MSELYFENQLRGYNVVFAAFQALTKDMCGKAMNLPVAVNRWIKMMGKLKRDLEKAAITEEKKKELVTRIDEYLNAAEGLPREPGPCQKTAGNCKIGPGCFATGALDLLKLITEPAPP
ncbi:MAG: hypothetical protein ABH874_07710 [Methanobacteriota archaeon]